MVDTKAKYENLLQNYKNYNVATGLISAGGEAISALINYNQMNKDRFNTERVSEVAPDVVSLQATDIFNPAVDEMERAYARGIVAARESGTDSYAALLSRFIEGIGRASQAQAQADIQTRNQEASMNLQSRMQARQTNAQIEQFNASMGLQEDQMQFQADSLFSTNIMRSIANMTNVISSIPLNNMQAELQMEDIIFNREIAERQLEGQGADPIQAAIAEFIRNKNNTNNSGEGTAGQSGTEGTGTGTGTGGESGTKGGEKQAVNLSEMSSKENFTEYASLSPAAKQFVDSIGGWKPYEYGKKGDEAYDCSGAACEYLGIDDIINTGSANIFDMYTNKGTENLLSEDELQDGDMIFLDKEGEPNHIGIVAVDENGNRWIAEQRSGAGSSFMNFDKRINGLKQSGYNIRYFRPKNS